MAMALLSSYIYNDNGDIYMQAMSAKYYDFTSLWHLLATDLNLECQPLFLALTTSIDITEQCNEVLLSKMEGSSTRQFM